jgi:hypothetical protein
LYSVLIDTFLYPLSLSLSLYKSKSSIPKANTKRDTMIIPPWYNHNTMFDNIKVIGKVYTIGSYAFAHLEQVESISLNDALTSINDFAFESLSTIETIELKQNVEQIGLGVFKNCENLKEIKVIETNIKYQSINNVLYTKPTQGQTQIRLVSYPMNKQGNAFQIHQSTSEIEAYAFYNNPTLKYIEINDGLQIIGEYSFSYVKSLRTITLPSSITTIKTFAFAESTSLKSFFYLGTTQLTCDNTIFTNTELENIRVEEHLIIK